MEQKEFTCKLELEDLETLTIALGLASGVATKEGMKNLTAKFFMLQNKILNQI